MVEESDWRRGDRGPTPLDFENARVAMSAQAVWEILESHHDRPGGPNPDEAWIMTVVKAVVKAVKGREDAYFGEDVLRNYTDHFGLEQVIRMFGGDVPRIKEQLDQLKSEEG